MSTEQEQAPTFQFPAEPPLSAAGAPREQAGGSAGSGTVPEIGSGGMFPGADGFQLGARMGGVGYGPARGK